MRACKGENVEDDDIKGRFIETGKIISKSGSNAVILKEKDKKIIKMNLRDVKRDLK